MKKSSARSTSARTALSILFLVAGIGILCAMPFVSQAGGIARKGKFRPAVAPPTGDAGTGNVGPAPGGPSASWNQVTPAFGSGGVNTEASCVEGVNCEHYLLTVNPGAWTGQQVRVQLNWGNTANEYDLYIHKHDASGAV